MSLIATTCPYCGVGCGVQITAGEGFNASGDCSHPANLGRLCSKGYALAETLELPGRLLYPQIGGQTVSWHQAIHTVAERLKRTLSRHGPDSIAFYVSGQLLTEDYYVANKLMKGFLGSANIDTNSRLCMASAVAAHKRAFGEDVVPTCYEDLELAEMVVVVGSNLAWCHPVLFRRLQQANPYLVVIDPRRTYTAASASLHLPVTPGSDAILFNGLLLYLYEHNVVDGQFVEQHTHGLKEALEAAKATAPNVSSIASACGLAEGAVRTFYRQFAASSRVVSLYSQGLNQSSSGTDKINALINCHLITGRIGREGCGPLSLTGQPNAMGGREVGALANQLAAHMELDDPDELEKVQRFWRAPAIAQRPGLKAVELFEATSQGRIRALWIMATNPAVSLPEAETIRYALERCEFLVVSDCVATTDTARFADVLLPAAAWSEKDGTVTNSVRLISRQRSFRAPPGAAKPDWWILCQVARAIGFGHAFAYASPAEIFREHAALSGLNQGRRLFDLSALATLTQSHYDALAPTPWPVTAERPAGTKRLFQDRRFPTADGKARFVAVWPRGPVNKPTSAYPLVLNTGRVRDHWHTLTRTGASPTLCRHDPEPYVELNPHDALAFGLKEGGLAQITGLTQRRIIARVRVSANQRRGSAFVPMHWNGAFAKSAWVNDLVPAITDPISGQPEFKHAPVQVTPLACAWYGFVLCRDKLEIARWPLEYWTCLRADFGVWRYELAGNQHIAWQDLLGPGAWIEYRDGFKGWYRAALVRRGRLHAYLCLAQDPSLPARAPIVALFHLAQLDSPAQAIAVAPHPTTCERTVCACFNVSEASVRQVLAESGNLQAVGERLGAGRKCGVCLPELEELIKQTSVQRR